MLNRGDIYILKSFHFVNGKFTEEFGYCGSMYIGNHEDFKNRFFFLKPCFLEKPEGLFATHLYGVVIGDHKLSTLEKHVIQVNDWVSINNLLDMTDFNYDIIRKTKEDMLGFPSTHYSNTLLSLIDYQMQQYNKQPR